eukprot:scaffold34268_cov43-Cyclotella_meneghiniana.AAC.8
MDTMTSYGDPGCHNDVTGPGLMMGAHQALDIRSTEYFEKVAHSRNTVYHRLIHCIQAIQSLPTAPIKLLTRYLQEHKLTLIPSQSWLIFTWPSTTAPLVTLDKNKVPVDPAAVPRMPDQIKISVTAQVEGREKEIVFYVAPCSAESPEEFLLYTWDQYMKSCKAKLPASLREDGPTDFRLFPLALGVSATNAWNKVLEENAVNAADEGDGTNDTSYENFKDCVALFLEEISVSNTWGMLSSAFSREPRSPSRCRPTPASVGARQ